MHGRRGSEVLQAEAGPYSRHLPALDGVRGLAVLGTLATHVFAGNAQTPMERFFAAVARFGASGVDLFFVLSGLLITGILYDTLGDTRYFRTFYMRRTLRILPLYYAVLFGFVLTTVFLGKHYDRELLSYALYLQNTGWIAPQVWRYHGPSMLPLDHFWSLAVEEQFYLVWPLLVSLLVTRVRILTACWVGIVVAFVLRVLVLMYGHDVSVVSTGTVFRMDSLLAGAALALLLRGPGHDRILRAGWWLFGVGMVIVGICLTGFHAGTGLLNFVHATYYTGLAASSVGLIAVCLRRGGAMERGFSVPAMRWLGRYSYGIYVLHMILRQLLLQPTKAMLLGHGMASKGAVVIVSGFLMIGLTLGAAWVSYHLYEVRFLRLKRFFAYGGTLPSNVASDLAPRTRRS